MKWKEMFKGKKAKTAGYISILFLISVFLVFSIRVMTTTMGIIAEWAAVLLIFGLAGWGLYYTAKRFSKRRLHTRILEAERLILSRRERQILQRIADGYTNREIGEDIYISESTVKKHVSVLFEKLNARRRTEAVKIARESGLID